MSFVFRGTRADIENGFPGFMPERRALVCTYSINYLHRYFSEADTCDDLLFVFSCLLNKTVIVFVHVVYNFV